MAEHDRDENTERWNASRAMKERPARSYAPVYVDVVRVDGDRVTLRVPGLRPDPLPEDLPPTPDPANDAGPQLKEIVVTWAKDNLDIWLEAPSTFPSQPPPSTPQNPDVPAPPPLEGQSGYLYLEDRILRNQGVLGDPKWPVAFPSPPPTAPLRIWPTSIVITGHELVTGENVSATIDLLNPRFASPQQTIELGTHRVEIQLTEEGFSAFTVSFPPK